LLVVAERLSRSNSTITSFFGVDGLMPVGGIEPVRASRKVIVHRPVSIGWPGAAIGTGLGLAAS
jgi:hypothetical protein